MKFHTWILIKSFEFDWSIVAYKMNICRNFFNCDSDGRIDHNWTAKNSLFDYLVKYMVLKSKIYGPNWKLP